MDKIWQKFFDILIESIVFIIFTYLLLGAMSSFRSSPAYILFFATNIWLIGVYYDRLKKLTDKKYMPFVIMTVSVSGLFWIIYFVGAVSMTVIKI